MNICCQPVLAGIVTLFITAACAQTSVDQGTLANAPDSAVDGASPGPYKIEFVEANRPTPGSRTRQLLLFVHGTPGSLTAFQRYLEDPVLQARYHMISVTRPGWVSDSDDKLPSLGDQARALEPLLRRDESGLGAILVGHSYGGPVIAKAAMVYPDLVAGLAFIASTGDPELSGPRWYNRIAAVLPKFLLGASLKGANAEIMPLAPQLEAMLPDWKNLDMPVLVVQGDRDRLVHPQNADFLMDALANADVTYLPMPGKGHFILWQDSELIRDTLLDVFDPPRVLACEQGAPQAEPQNPQGVVGTTAC